MPGHRLGRDLPGEQLRDIIQPRVGDLGKLIDWRATECAPGIVDRFDRLIQIMREISLRRVFDRGRCVLHAAELPRLLPREHEAQETDRLLRVCAAAHDEVIICAGEDGVAPAELRAFGWWIREKPELK